MAFLRSSSRFLTLLPFFTVGFVIGYCNVLPTLVTSRFLHISSALVSSSPHENTSRRRPPVKITLEPLPHPSSSSLALHVPAAPAPPAQQAHTDAFASVFTAQSAAALRTRQQLVSPPAPDLKATAESSLAAAVGRSSCKSLREWAVPLCRGALAATQALQVIHLPRTSQSKHACTCSIWLMKLYAADHCIMTGISRSARAACGCIKSAARASPRCPRTAASGALIGASNSCLLAPHTRYGYLLRSSSPSF